jgi:hypothetical protein
MMKDREHITVVADSLGSGTSRRRCRRDCQLLP